MGGGGGGVRKFSDGGVIKKNTAHQFEFTLTLHPSKKVFADVCLVIGIGELVKNELMLGPVAEDCSVNLRDASSNLTSSWAILIKIFSSFYCLEVPKSGDQDFSHLSMGLDRRARII